MRVISHSDPARFAELVRPLLLRDEAQHCLVLGILDTLVTQPERYASSQLISIEGSDGLEGVAWRTPPHALGLSLMSSAAVSALVEHLSSDAELPGVTGPRPMVDQFKEGWLERRRGTLRHCIQQRIYRLEQVVSAERSPGVLRTATAADEALVVDWTVAFVRECGLGDDEDEVRRGVAATLGRGRRVLWEHEGANVSTAGFGGKTPSGMRVSYVYTPPRLRGRGYASALVAALSEQLLVAGNRCCFLFTDLGNPTSNAIYQRIGYQPVGDAAHFLFSP
ncbi:MAG: hypothetical protein RL685_288 [Pseudomonadota bacterium]|jgi:predicted GNAT family acetyltransferase